MKNPLAPVLFTLALASTAPAQVGDDCANAVPLAGPTVVSMAGYTASPEPWNPWFPPQADRWFTFTPAQTGTFQIEACNTGQAVDAVAAIYSGGCGQLTYVAGDDDSCGQNGVGARIDTVLNGGTTYYIRVGNYGPPGSFTVSVGAGIGTLTPTAAGGCGSLGLEFSGSLAVSQPLTATAVNSVGIALVGAGVTPLGVSFCGCTVGHDWTVLGSGGSLQIWIPPDPSLVGFAFLMQGADLVSLGTCPASGLSLSTTYSATVGL